MINKLFVYGTLMPGQPNEHILQRIGGTWERAAVKGKLYKKGWGAALGYPGVVLSENGTSLDGYVFTSEHLEHHWAELDEFEGEGYERVVTLAEIAENRSVKAFIYELKDKIRLEPSAINTFLSSELF